MLDKDADEDALYMFLTYRCDRAFMDLYVSRHPEFIELQLTFGSFMGSVPEVSVIARLHEFQLLPEAARQRFVARARELAVDTPDSDWLGYERIRAVFTKDEVTSILDLVRTGLVPNIDDTVQDWRVNYDRFYEPDSYFEPVKDVITTYQTHLADDDSRHILGSALEEIDAEIDELRVDPARWAGLRNGRHSACCILMGCKSKARSNAPG